MVQLGNTHHFNFTVADMDRSLGFWRDTLGLEVLNDWVSEAGYLAEINGYPKVRMRLAFLKLPGTEAKLELIQYLEPPGAPRDLPTNVPGAAHLCFDVPDIQAAYEELRARGVRFRSAPVEITSAANRGARGVYLVDPDGITVELRQPPAG
jgi:catechol 2,3-dioxygenase-like lactoylglutathione lyase family enzyme